MWHLVYADEDIDDDKVWAALKEAQLDEFVRSLPEGLDTGIGERGIRISGGQRQRISIARALFEDPEVLIMDEATSALDNDTEAAIMDSINRLHGRKTMVIIAHRLQTIEKCDIVYRVGRRKGDKRTIKGIIVAHSRKRLLLRCAKVKGKGAQHGRKETSGRN